MCLWMAVPPPLGHRQQHLVPTTEPPDDDGSGHDWWVEGAKQDPLRSTKAAVGLTHQQMGKRNDAHVQWSLVGGQNHSTRCAPRRHRVHTKCIPLVTQDPIYAHAYRMQCITLPPLNCAAPPPHHMAMQMGC